MPPSDTHPYNTDYIEIPTYSRKFKSETGEDGFFSQTLASAVTIPSVRTFRLTTLQPSLPSQPPSWPSATTPPGPIAVPGADLLMHLALAKPGVCGHPATAHGGVLATIIDEAMSLGVTLYAPEAGETGKTGRIRSKMFTAQLDLRYKRPVAVPGDLEVRVSVLAKQDKKVWVRAQAVQKGEIMVDAVAFWLLVAPAPAAKSVL
ncbi:HotDog domain-containing protein [Aspergillus insuetus]